jgi:hypothetical protein
MEVSSGSRANFSTSIIGKKFSRQLLMKETSCVIGASPVPPLNIVNNKFLQMYFCKNFCLYLL